MKQYFAAACVAASAILTLAPQAAYAKHHTTHAGHSTTHVKHPTTSTKHSRLRRSRIHPVARNEATPWLEQAGTASYYGPAHQGRLSASGRRFDERELTAAHPWLPFGTRVKVTRADTGKSISVIITDRMPANGRVVDLSLAAARQLGMVHRGLAEVIVAPPEFNRT
ncbi:MAG TPA: septal ring lytic transglycosylase RlpA family protein [Rhodopila sp.]|nr:septal ring lytic transglycosylase RlpA family protein [Rhodopila sp.]